MSIKATCNDCGYSASLDSLRLHSCQIQQSGGQCEDFPACGHTDGDGCQTLPEHTSAYWIDMHYAARDNGYDLSGDFSDNDY